MSEAQETPFAPFAGRLLWMLLGPLALTLALFSVVGGGSAPPPTGADLAAVASVGAMLLGRWLEFRGGAPRTADGAPATPAHLRRFLIGLPLVAAVLWLAARLIAWQTAGP